MGNCGLPLSPRRHQTVLLFLCVVVLLVASCQKAAHPGPAVRIAHEIAPLPARVGVATITLRVSDASEKAITGAKITLEGNMSHAGMAPAFGEMKETAPGRYQGTLELAMAGDWIVTIHLTLAHGEKVEEQIEIKGVRAN